MQVLGPTPETLFISVSCLNKTAMGCSCHLCATTRAGVGLRERCKIVAGVFERASNVQRAAKTSRRSWASAGGLEAYKDFLHGLPVDTGMASIFRRCWKMS
jgi:hypothetical protein